MKFNFKKISAIASSILLTGMTMGIAAAANYPAPFVSGGTADVAIVYGTGAGVSALDLVQAGNIQSNLQSKMGAASGTTSTATVSGGDSVLLAKSSDHLNLGDTWGVFTGTITKTNLPTLLADGTYVASDNDEFNYEQKITLGTPTLSHFRDSDYESLVGLDTKTPTIGFNISSNTYIMNYTLDFTQDAESDISGGDLVDIEGSDIPLLGKTYYVSDLANGTSSSFLGKMTLLDSAEIGTLKEGETTTVDGHEVSISFIDSSHVKFNVDGNVVPSSGKLQAGESAKIPGGNDYIGVRDISKLEVSGETGSTSFSIGSGKLEITSGSDIVLNDETVSGVKGWVYRGTANGAAEKIDKIVIEWKTDDEEFLTPKHELVMPGFGAVKFSMGDFVRPPEEKLTLEKDSDTSIKLITPIKDGDIDIDLLYANSTGDLVGIGKASDERLATSGNGTLVYQEKDGNGNDYDKYFIATYNTTTDSESYLLRAKVSQDTTNNRNETTIERYINGAWSSSAGCKDRANGDTCDLGSVTLTLSNIEYTAGGGENVTINGGTNVNFHTLYTPGGLSVYLPYTVINGSSAYGAINVTDANAWANSQAGHDYDTFKVYMDGEDKDDTLMGGTAFYFTIDDTSDNNLQVKYVDGSGTGGPDGKEVGTDTGIYEAYIRDDVAPRILHYTKPDEDWAEIYYPTGNSESYAEVYLTAPNAVVTPGTTATTGSATQLGDVLVKDSEVSSVSTKNLIIVGGSCINSAAATVLGGAYCGAAFTKATGVGSGQFLIKGVADKYSAGKIALVVAGYDAQDTVNAATYLRTQTVDTSKEYRGTSATSATLVTTTA